MPEYLSVRIRSLMNLSFTRHIREHSCGNGFLLPNLSFLLHKTVTSNVLHCRQKCVVVEEIKNNCAGGFYLLLSSRQVFLNIGLKVSE